VRVGAAGVSVGLGVYFTGFAGGASSSTGAGAAPSRASAPRGGVQSVSVRVRPGGAALVGRF
ncbi:MAG: hypothetical protein WKG00_02405, partial [Polyangiaceae bacterium]